MVEPNSTTTNIIEFYPQAIFDIITLFILIHRRRKIKKTGHSYFEGFPYTIKVKMLFIFIWGIFTLIQIGLVLFTSEHVQLWIL
jgi:hypothetical protein